MTISEEFSQVLHDWSETLMRRSMHDFIQFSKDSGLSMPQIRTLFHLSHDGKCGVSEIGELLGVTNPAASQMIDRLVIDGYIERSEDPADRRAKRLKLTGKGRAIVTESIEIRSRWMENRCAMPSTIQMRRLSKTASTMKCSATGRFGRTAGRR